MWTGIVGQNSDPTLEYTVSPSGGVIVLEPTSSADYGTWTLTRYLSVAGNPVSGVVLNQGSTGEPPIQVFVDTGDGMNVPLDSNSLYCYGLATGNGSVMTPPLSPACTITLEPDQINQILFRSLQSGVQALRIPASFQNRPVVLHAMPLAGAGMPPLPAITFNESFLQQQDIPIGQNVDSDYRVNKYQLSSQSIRHFTVFVMAASVREREFYKDAVIGIFNSILGPVLDKIGNNVSHRFQVSSSQLVSRNTEPGYYFSEIMLEFCGLYTLEVTTDYGKIEHFSYDAYASGVVSF